jgi:acyl carrier protein
MSENTVTAGSEIRQSVEKVITDALVDFGFESDEIAPAVSLIDLGVSSLDVAELIQILREEFRVEVQGQELAECLTLADVIDLVAAKVAAVRTPDA